jgi:hypothetical protein
MFGSGGWNLASDGTTTKTSQIAHTDYSFNNGLLSAIFSLQTCLPAGDLISS